MVPASERCRALIPVRNIYYMLAYAFNALQADGYSDVATEEFANTADLFAAILARGVAIEIKRGLGREYIDRTEELSTLRGKIDITESMKQLTFQNKRMVCTFDEFSVDFTMNRILKSTMLLLLKAELSRERKKELRRLLVYFADVSEIDLSQVTWRFRYHRNNQNYRLLLGICYLAAEGLLQTQSDGSKRLMNFLDDQRLSALYEKFILNFYKKEHPKLDVAASQVSWQLDEPGDIFLPTMKTDVTLGHQDNILILDAKYYQKRSMQHSRFGVKVRSAHLYQMFTYVKNKALEVAPENIEVSGLLLYGKTDEDVVPDSEYQMSGNRICLKALDLDQDFAGIRADLDAIPREFLGI